MATLIARFQTTVRRVDTLSNGASSAEALVESFLGALAARDSAALATLFLSRAEFAHIYFPASELARPPYELDPALAWLQLSAGSERGIRKTLSRLGGRSLEYVSHACVAEAPLGREARLWRGCTVNWREPGAAVSEASLFGAILEYEGRFKFLSYDTAR